jgi:hypothetical protein
MRRSRADWEKIVAEFEAIGEQHVPFCERRRISLHSFATGSIDCAASARLALVARSATKPKAFGDNARRSVPPSAGAAAAIIEARLRDGVHDRAREGVADRIEVN